MAKLILSDGKWLCASNASPLMLGKGMKPASADTDIRIEFGPAAAQIAVCVPGSQALVPDTVCAGRMRNPPQQEELSQDNCPCEHEEEGEG